MDFLTFFQYTFIQKAFLAGSFIAILCSILGLFLVLRNLSLVGDGLSHVTFGAIALGLFLGISPFWTGLIMAVIGAIFLFLLSEKTRVFADTAIGIVSSAGIAIGIMLASLSNGFNVDLLSYLFGSILAISSQEMWLSIFLCLLVLLLIFLFFHELFSLTFDEMYAKASGIPVKWFHLFLLILTALSVVLSVRIVGVMLVSALLILPATTSLQIARSFKQAILFTSLFAISSVILGVSISFLLDVPTGAMIVLINLGFFILSLLKKYI